MFNARDKPSRGTSGARGEQESAETFSFRCDCERCRLMRGAVKPSSATHVAHCDETSSLALCRESGFAYGRNVASPDSEQIEHVIAEQFMRNSVSVEQIQDRVRERGKLANGAVYRDGEQTLSLRSRSRG
mgnify:CR=1 FL=1